MIIGKSGSGKSYFLKTLIAHEWANGTRVIVLDPEAEYLTLTRNLAGNIIDVGNAKEGRINPFHIYKILTEDGTPADPKVTFNTHLKMLESFFKIVLADAPVDVIELINNLVVETYERMGITENTDCSAFPADYFPLFSDLLETLQSKDKESMDDLTKRDMRTAELYLKKFVSGRYSDIWNAPSTLKTGRRPYRFRFPEPVCEQEQYGGKRADAAYLPIHRTGSHQRARKEQGRGEPSYAHHCRRSAPLYRPEIPDCARLFLFDVKAYPQV